jgi:hypothetical protein
MDDIINTVKAIVDRVVYGEHTGRYHDDAGEWFDEPTWAGFDLFVNLEQIDIRGEDFGGMEGGIAVTDPNGLEHEFQVTTDGYGDVTVARPWYARV